MHTPPARLLLVLLALLSVLAASASTAAAASARTVAIERVVTAASRAKSVVQTPPATGLVHAAACPAPEAGRQLPSRLVIRHRSRGPPWA